MAKIKINYTEIDGLLYPDLEIENNELLNSLGKYGTLRLRYLYEYKPEMYRELLLTDKLAEHCGSIDNAAFERAECIRSDYFKENPMPKEDTMERIRLSTLAQQIADEVVITELIYQ